MSYQNGIYSLLKVEDVYDYGTKESISSEQVQEVIKDDYKSIVNWEDMFDDLDSAFYKVLTLTSTKIKELYFSNKVNAIIRYPQSSSNLCKEFASTYIGTTIKAGGLTWNFNAKQSFKKGKIYFDKEAYIEDYPEGKSKATAKKNVETYAKWVEEELERAAAAGEPFKLHKTRFVGKNVGLRKYINGIADLDETEYTAMVDILIDDFITSGATLQMMRRQLKVKDDSVVAVSLFKLK